jgi:acetyl-CoA acetyltransferase family protein
MQESFIPYGAYWSTPFARWQGSLAHLHALQFAAHVAKAELARRDIPASALDHAVLGTTVPQKSSFYGAPWLMGMIGNDRVGGPTINQACATGARALLAAQQEIASGLAQTALVVTADRCSNGPHLYYPEPQGPGGTGAHEDWVLDNFGSDPYAGVAMLDTAENVARKYQASREEQHAVVLRRHEQYTAANPDFRRRYMTLPLPVPDARFRRTVAELAGDEGIHPTTREGLERLRPVREGGSVTFGSQTHPADGNAAVVVATRERARRMTARPEIEIRLAGFGVARTDKAFMPEAPVPAARRALDQAGWRVDELAAIKTHNPFAVNDIVFARETGADLMAMNNNGCSLIWGHPQGPTGLRTVLELIEELVDRGGGRGLFTGCAAGDCAMAVALDVRDARPA